MRLTPDPAMGPDGAGVAGFEAEASASRPLLEISNATVRVYKATFGRGPTRARARFAGADTLVVLLEDTLTVSERRLATLGEHARLRDQRMLLHDALEEELRGVVETILGRRTLALISGIDIAHDVVAEVFLLEGDARAREGTGG